MSNVSISETYSDPYDSLYIGTPKRRKLKEQPVVDVHSQLIVGDVLDIVHLVSNVSSLSHKPGCEGSNLQPAKICTSRLGGSFYAVFACKGCGASVEYSNYGKAMAIAKLVATAFIVSGCLYATYSKVLKLALGMSAWSSSKFCYHIKVMHPVVKRMLDNMCEVAKKEMQMLKPGQLGSWKQAVTTADGAWQTRGYHSKNFTYSVRNYMTNSLLYYKHLSQGKSDNASTDELYQGTSKSMEGYSARLLMKQASEEGMTIVVNWQDADSSSANAIKSYFSDAQIMICGGHATRAHVKVLENYSKWKKPTKQFVVLHKRNYPNIENVECKCDAHRSGCGCLRDEFITKARNNFSYICDLEYEKGSSLQINHFEICNKITKKLKASEFHFSC